MSASDFLSMLFAVGGAMAFVALVKFGAVILETVWYAMRDGFEWVIELPVRPRKEKLTPLQIEFKTTMKWHEIRWSIARLEHQLMPKDEWTHDVADCVDPKCNPDFVERMNSGVPILKSPPPPPPPPRARGLTEMEHVRGLIKNPGRTEKR